MVFSSPVFLFLFLPIFLTFAALFRGSGKNVVILLFSLLFYSWGEPVYILLLLASIGINYASGLAIAASDRPKLLVGLAVALNLALLVIFKYLGLLTSSLEAILPIDGISADIALPLGISFYTFQGISYIIDVARDRRLADKSFINIATYISMFPQLVAGPIVRFETVAAQLRDRVENLSRYRLGLTIFIIGLAQKVIFADNFAPIADRAFDGTISELSMLDAWIGAIAYSLQIFFDFAGYSNMAIGLGAFLGFTFPKNFNYPYISRSITEFWRRWHMSLSSWFRDYLYIPLGGNRAGPWRTYFNLVTVFFLCGLWHGASWSFVFWGLLHGAFLVIERVGLGKLLERLPGVVALAYTLFAVQIAWVFFRAEDFGDAGAYLAAMFGQNADPVSSIYLEVANLKYLLLTAFGLFCASDRSEFIGRVFGDWREAFNTGQAQVTMTGVFARYSRWIELGVFLVFLLSIMAIASNA